MPHANNQLLARLHPSVLLAIRPDLRVVELRHGEVLADTHQRVQRVIFPHAGILSFVVELKNGQAIETGMVGRDGEFGGAQAMDDKVSLNRVVVQVPGRASVIDVDRLRRAADSLPSLRTLLVKYELFFLAQVQQTAACNAVHDVHTRACKWLLRMHQLAGDDLPLTQEFLAQMMGVRRTSITGAAVALQKAGLISYFRGHIHIDDIQRVQSQACECHAAMEAHFERIFGPHLFARLPARKGVAEPPAA
jgi:CRP-like cAMP-binding protein